MVIHKETKEVIETKVVHEYNFLSIRIIMPEVFPRNSQSLVSPHLNCSLPGYYKVMFNIFMPTSKVT